MQDVVRVQEGQGGGNVLRRGQGMEGAKANIIRSKWATQADAAACTVHQRAVQPRAGASELRCSRRGRRGTPERLAG